LKDKRLVAIKRCKLVGERQEFGKVMVILSHVKHRNVVRLYCCCLYMEVLMLVYQFIPNGTLYQLIHGRSQIQAQSRISFAHETAEALAYLHSWTSPPIIHGDVKSRIYSRPIFLSTIGTRRRSRDFGVSALLALTDKARHVTFVQGTYGYGYLELEYMHTSKLRSKSLNVVLLLLLTSAGSRGAIGYLMGSYGLNY
jgi:serine/threonine protein kinase